VLDGIGGDGPQPIGVRLSPEVLTSRPSRIRVGGLHPRPLASLLEHAQGLAGEGLRQLLGGLLRRGAKGRQLVYERMFA
jgi:hypothetical protein